MRLRSRRTPGLHELNAVWYKPNNFATPVGSTNTLRNCEGIEIVCYFRGKRANLWASSSKKQHSEINAGHSRKKSLAFST